VCECLGGKPGRATNVDGGNTGQPARKGVGGVGTTDRPGVADAGAVSEHKCWDPKDGELCLDRMKPGETLVEVRRRSDVQIDGRIWA